MKEHYKTAVFTVLIALCLFLSPASALTRGDADGDGKIEAADARIVLRTAVFLDKLDKRYTAATDMNSNGVSDAYDARSILRLAVGLEEAVSPGEHCHSFIYTPCGDDSRLCIKTCRICLEEEALPHAFSLSEVIKAPTCTEAGSAVYTCSCGASETEDIKPEGHSKLTLKGREASCTLDGFTDEIICSKCGKVFKEKEIFPSLHTLQLKKFSAEKPVICETCGQTVTDSFNGIMNRVSTDTRLTYYSKNYTDVLFDKNGSYPAENPVFSDVKICMSPEETFYPLEWKIKTEDVAEISAEKALLADTINNTDTLIHSLSGETTDLSAFRDVMPDRSFLKISLSSEEVSFYGDSAPEEGKADIISGKNIRAEITDKTLEMYSELSPGDIRISYSISAVHYCDEKTFAPVFSLFTLTVKREAEGFSTVEKTEKYYFFEEFFDSSEL